VLVPVFVVDVVAAEEEEEVVVETVPAAKLLSLPPDATRPIPAATKPNPTTHHTVVSSSCAFLTPAGLPTGNGPVVVAAMALDVRKVAATVAATKFRMGLLLFGSKNLG
jgi:hypothetical protein